MFLEGEVVEVSVPQASRQCSITKDLELAWRQGDATLVVIFVGGYSRELGGFVFIIQEMLIIIS